MNALLTYIGFISVLSLVAQFDFNLNGETQKKESSVTFVFVVRSLDSVCYSVLCMLCWGEADGGEVPHAAALCRDGSEVAMCYTPTSPNATC